MALFQKDWKDPFISAHFISQILKNLEDCPKDSQVSSLYFICILSTCSIISKPFCDQLAIADLSPLLTVILNMQLSLLSDTDLQIITAYIQLFLNMVTKCDTTEK